MSSSRLAESGTHSRVLPVPNSHECGCPPEAGRGYRTYSENGKPGWWAWSPSIQNSRMGLKSVNILSSKVARWKANNNEDKDCKSTAKGLRRVVSNRRSAGSTGNQAEYAWAADLVCRVSPGAQALIWDSFHFLRYRMIRMLFPFKVDVSTALETKPCLQSRELSVLSSSTPNYLSMTLNFASPFNLLNPLL